ncbi:MAG: hypothetical protein WCG63_07450 [Opitutaceae bacterium]
MSTFRDGMINVIDERMSVSEAVKKLFTDGVEIDLGWFGERMGREMIQRGVKPAALCWTNRAEVAVGLLAQQPLIAQADFVDAVRSLAETERIALR